MTPREARAKIVGWMGRHGLGPPRFEPRGFSEGRGRPRRILEERAIIREIV